MRRLRVLVLTHPDLVPPQSVEGLSDEEISPFKMEYDVTATLEQLGHEVRVLGAATELAPIRETIAEWKPHIVFNLLLHFHDIGLYGSYVVSYLELLKTPYTGCNSRGLLLADDKVLSKKILGWHRISTPGWTAFRRGRVVRAPRKLTFPLFVKSAAEHASIGISQASIVHDEAGLVERVEFIHRTVGTDAIVEEYIDGRELTVGLIGNQRVECLPVWELRFENLPDSSAPIATSRVKWDLKYQERIGLQSGPAKDLSKEKHAEIGRIARRIYRALGLSGYARIDFRMRADGRLFVLEANPNPDLCFGEDFAESADRAGTPYPKLIQRLLNLGLRYEPAWKQV